MIAGRNWYAGVWRTGKLAKSEISVYVYVEIGATG